MLHSIDFSKSNRYWGLILLVGVALGAANYSLGIWASMGQSMVLQIIISALIGYPLLVVGYNERNWWPVRWPVAYRFAILLLLFAVIGIIGSEGQVLFPGRVIMD